MSAADKDEQRLDALLAAYGANPVRWPEEEAGALAMRADLHAQAAQERALDEMLDAYKVDAPDAALHARILAAYAAQTEMRPARQSAGFWRGLAGALWPEGPSWVPMGTCAAALLLGLYIGASGALTAMSSDPQTERALLSLAMADSVFEENWNE